VFISVLFEPVTEIRPKYPISVEIVRIAYLQRRNRRRIRKTTEMRKVSCTQRRDTAFVSDGNEVDTERV